MKKKKVRLGEIESNPDAEALIRSDKMRPYLDCMVASLGNDLEAYEVALKKVEALPLEKRYIWRIVQALDWGFADFDSAFVRLDMECLSADPDEHKKAAENFALKLRDRALQFCFFLEGVLGTEAMKVVMENALEAALGEDDENEEVN